MTKGVQSNPPPHGNFLSDLCFSAADQSRAALLNFGKPTSQWLTLGAPFSSSDATGNSSTKTSNLLTWTYKSDGSTQLSKQLQVGYLLK